MRADRFGRVSVGQRRHVSQRLFFGLQVSARGRHREFGAILRSEYGGRSLLDLILATGLRRRGIGVCVSTSHSCGCGWSMGGGDVKARNLD